MYVAKSNLGEVTNLGVLSSKLAMKLVKYVYINAYLKSNACGETFTSQNQT